MITAPFNFVPLNEKVFFPDWAEDVSHDIPFRDGESGVIDITITTKSPIFIRDHENPEQFCSHNGEYYIPSTSIKGMVRNVLEIMSFSKMSFVDDKTYAVRDLSSAQNFYMKQMSLLTEPTTRCGWLKKTENGYVIEDCGVPGRIHHKQIDCAFDVKFSKYFEPKLFDVKFSKYFEPKLFDEKDQTQKSAEYKYEKLGMLTPQITVGDKYKSEKNPKYDKREFYKFQKDGQKATLVLAGQPTPRKNTGEVRDGKGFEFIFFDSKDELKVSKDIFENFLFAYFDKRDTEPKESPDWTFWKEKLYSEKKIPVFFQKSGKTILHFGLSYLYKLPYKHSVYDGIYTNHFDNRLDLAQAIFGFTDGKDALKGRVQFSHFIAVSNAKELPKRTEILGAPRASYYPIYVRQCNTDFKTYMDSNFKIAGWKRYPIHKNGVKKTEDTGNKNVGTTFAPLDKGVVFKGKLRCHNLRKAELGAILSALTFHNTANTYHNIGMAKSLGYGKIELKVDINKDINEYLKEFELIVSQQIPNWAESEQLKELITMATEQDNSGNSSLKYMKLEEFASSKSKSKDYLKVYSELDNIKLKTVASLISEEDLQEFHKKQIELVEKQKKDAEAKKAKEEFERRLQEAKTNDNIDVKKAFISKYPESEETKELQKIVEEIELKQKENRFQEVNQKAQNAYDQLMKNRANAKKFKKDCEKFVKKWSAGKNNKGSELVLELVEKVEKGCDK
ncbi:MAG: TIGR03986 family CRISPR-associated RAMP protein [Sulfurimonas sp.]|nr:TIGR03986 family CRISPR-associated RAMP protein [Sulfurimonas sp.]